jgi:proteasome lid subunit RPN8/RPN11
MNSRSIDCAPSPPAVDLISIEQVIHHRPQQTPPPTLENWLGTEALQWAIAPKAQRTLSQHAQSNTAIEVGGLLIGNVYEHQHRYWVNVTHALPARHTQAHSHSLIFTHQTWFDLVTRRDRHPKKLTVGWYHTHPGIGIFLSEPDRQIHRQLFAEYPWSLAIVLDPKSKDQGIFVWQDEQLVRCPITCSISSRSPSQ